MFKEIKINYGTLFEEALLKEIEEIGVYKEVRKDDKLIEIGAYVKSMPLLISGAIKILREDNDGNELFLYFLEKGDTCAMTLSCCIGQGQSKIRAVAEVDSSLYMIPVQKMEEWTSKYKSWRNFVFASYHNRLLELLETIDNIAFLNLDQRLLKYLHDKSKISNSNVVSSTHQEIAYDLNTSRVVISRLLKTLENKNIIELQRNKIILLES
ncbi:MAG: Crp/Fnr family transcriptional regulator [Flavobacteriaceae bacterium]